MTKDPVIQALDARDRRLVRLFTACVLGRFDVVRAVRTAAPPSEPDRAWRETLLQVHVFAGVPRAVECYTALSECGGLGEIHAAEITEAADADERGLKLFERIYGRSSAEVRAMLTDNHPVFAATVLEHAYGRILSRDGLDPARRELLACAALAALAQDRQLASHARGAIRCGATAAAVLSALDEIADLIPPDRLDEARRVIHRFAVT
jgi:alkylhydroperoxidase/carboxymuconolactone decarboxylase family protein YurZ